MTTRRWSGWGSSVIAHEPVTGGLRITLPADPALAAQVARLATEQDGRVFVDVTLQFTPAALIFGVRIPESPAAVVADLLGVVT